MAMTAQVKAELASTKVTKSCCRKSEVSSMLRFAGGLHIVSGRIVVEDAPFTAVELTVRGAAVTVQPGSPVSVVLQDQGLRLPSMEGSPPVLGENREDGSVVRAIVPESHPQEVTSSD